MNPRFKQLVDQFDVSFQRLVLMEPVKVTSLPRDMPTSGVYLFSERDCHLYVGRSNRLRVRLQEHGRPSSTHNSAPFAFNIARRATGRMEATYDSKGSRASLESEPEFSETFAKAKERVHRMDIRYVKEDDPLKQALLEIYVAIALDTPYNEFGTH